MAHKKWNRKHWDWGTVQLTLEDGEGTLKWECLGKNYEWTQKFPYLEFFIMEAEAVEEDKDLPELNVTRFLQHEKRCMYLRDRRILTEHSKEIFHHMFTYYSKC